MSVKTSATLLSASCCLLLSLPLTAADIRVVTEYRSHYQLQNEDGSLGGYMTDIIRALFEITGDKPIFEVHPWGRTYAEALNTPNVMIYSMSFNPARAALFDCVAELDSEQLYFWALKSRVPLALNSISELYQYRIGVTQSSNPDQYLTGQGLPKLLRIATPEQALGMLYKERLDLVISAEVSVMNRAVEMGFDPSQLKKVFSLDELNHPICAAFNLQSDSDLRQRYRAAFVTLQQNGTLEQIRQRWQVVEN
ncbi:MAG TPA: transporter substrate-binding domain-containing protein [Rheinheimera sp.]|nr:transporter substrate-binding domain-containing protein [Rheinheimera sp.]